MREGGGRGVIHGAGVTGGLEEAPTRRKEELSDPFPS